MSNKKTIIGIIIVVLLIIALIAISYFYNDFNTKQITTLSEEANKILEVDLTQDYIDFEIKTEKNYAKVEKAVKEYTSSLKNIYVEMEEMASGINPNVIFSAENMENKKLDAVDDILSEYKNKAQDLISEYEELVKEENIIGNMSKYDITTRREYYTNLYNDIMFSEMMQKKYNKLEEEIKNQKGNLYDKLNKLQKIKEFFEKNENDWTIKDDQIQITNIIKITEYYNLVNQIID